jgi:hypothetical protein
VSLRTWRGGRAVECAGLENRYGLSVHRGFESPPLRTFRPVQTQSRAPQGAARRRVRCWAEAGPSAARRHSSVESRQPVDRGRVPRSGRTRSSTPQTHARSELIGRNGQLSRSDSERWRATTKRQGRLLDRRVAVVTAPARMSVPEIATAKIRRRRRASITEPGSRLAGAQAAVRPAGRARRGRRRESADAQGIRGAGVRAAAQGR